jgi:D-methionine transport system substrate-binding protein
MKRTPTLRSSNLQPSKLTRRLFMVAFSVFATSVTLHGCAGSQPTASSETDAASESIRVGVSPVPHAEILEFVKDNLAADAGLSIEIVEFSDYVQPNLALNDGQIDANYFQHVPYMEDFGNERGIDMVAVVPVHIEPLGLYSRRIQSLGDVSDGATIAIPNDATNLGRALNLIADQGLITLRAGAGISATVQDIEDNPKNLNFVELEAAQLPRSLDDTDLAIINGNYAIQIGLTPSQDALALETADDNPYANVLSVLRGRESDPNVRTLAELLDSPEVEEFIEQQYNGSVIPAS